MTAALPTPVRSLFASAAGPTYTPRVITPEIAPTLLATSVGNRNISRGRVRQYARDMASGNWRANGQTIVFDDSGHLVDGHHRLQAVIESGATVTMLVARGVPADAVATIDAGRPRSFADVLGMRGAANRNAIGGIVTWICRWEQGDMLTTDPVSHVEREEALARWETVVQAATDMAPLPRGVRTAAVGFVYAVGLKRDPACAEAFFVGLRDGLLPSTRHPLYQLRQRLMETAGRTGAIKRVEACALVVKAWNYAKQGRTDVGQLRWRRYGPAAEPFPELL